MKIYVLSIIMLFTFAVIFPQHLFAATTKAQPKKNTKTSTKQSTFPASVTVKVSKDKKSVTVTFSNLKNVSSVSYMLSYDTRDNTEGAVGSIKPKGATVVTRKLLFGTCSSGVCRYHRNISNASLEVTVTTKKGSSTRTYPIKL